MKWQQLCLSSAIALTLAAPALAEPTTMPTAAAPTTRRARGINMEGPALKYHALFPKPTDLADPAQRAAKGAEAIATLKPLVAELDAQAPSMQKMTAPSRDLFVTVLVALGDAETRAAVDKQAATPGPEADRAKRILAKSSWMVAARDPAAQAPMADAFEQQAKANPADTDVTVTLASMSGYAATPELKKRLMDAAMGMDNRIVTALKAQQAKTNKLKVAEGKPMVLAGATPDGKPFTTADWKGRVILVDFWAGWCGPCRAELPRVKKAYADYHDKGFEVLGVDNDYSVHAVTAAATAEALPWPQLFDAEAAASKKWNAITSTYGIDGIPVMFLIDKNGVCRTVTAREDFEKRIPEMLAE